MTKSRLVPFWGMCAINGPHAQQQVCLLSGGYPLSSGLGAAGCAWLAFRAAEFAVSLSSEIKSSWALAVEIGIAVVLAFSIGSAAAAVAFARLAYKVLRMRNPEDPFRQQ